MTRERPSWEVPTEAAETSASKEGAPKAEQTSAEGTPAVADILDELDQPSPSEEGTTDAAESASPAEDVTAEAEDAPSEEDKPEEAGGDDLLSSSAFLKAKQKVLEKELAEVVEATAAANAEQEAAAAEWEDQRVRLEKDFSNFRARQEDLKLEAQRGASVKVLEAFLTFLDNFDRARPIAPEESKEEYDNVYAALLRTLDEEIGLKKIPTVGEEFDYNLHNAIQQLPSDEYEENVIMSEMQSGFTLGGMVVRPAYVMVSAG